MNLRKSRATAAATALLLAGALALTGCSGNAKSSASATPSATAGAKALTDVDCSTLTIDSDSKALPTVKGDAGAEPTLTWSGDSAPSNLTVKTLTEGKGTALEANDSVTVNYAGWQWGKDKVFDSSYTRGQAATFTLNGVIAGWRCGLLGHKAGDRLEIAIPSQLAYGDDSTTGNPTGPLVFVVEIQSVESEKDAMAATASATMVGDKEVADRGITVTGDLGTAATIKVNEGATEPTKAEVIVLAKGTGEPIKETDTILTYMAYTTWDNATSASFWELHQAQSITLSTAPDLAGLVGVPAGSRVVVLLPKATDSTSGSTSPAQAYVMDIVKAE